MRRIAVPFAEMDFSYVRSSGPGGQNVNKVNSKAVLRWNAFASQALAGLREIGARERVLRKLAPRLTETGELVITSDSYRDQPRNREDCIDKLHDLLEESLRVPKPRKATKPSKSSQRRRQEGKRIAGDKKKLRGRVDY